MGSTTISATLDYAAAVLTVDQNITYPLLNTAEIAEIPLILEPLTLSADFSLFEATASGRRALAHRQDGELIWLELTPEEIQGDRVSVDLHYSYKLSNRNGTLGSTPYQTNLGEWYAVIPPQISGSSWLVHPRGKVGEHVANDPVNFSVQLEITNPPANLVVAASAPYTIIDNRLSFSLPASRSFALSLSPYYQQLTASAGITDITISYYPQHQEAAQAALDVTLKALTLYSSLYSSSPYTSLSVVESLFPDGMEYQGMFFLGQEYFADYQEEPDGYLIPIAVHETAHQWWYGLVGNDPALEPWLDEVLCTYSEALFFEHHFPENLSWWWDFRVERFNPSGWVDSTIYDHLDFRSYVDAVYLRGAIWLQAVRQQLGDDAFFLALNEYAGSFAGERASGEQFLALIDDQSTTDLSQIMAEFFQDPPGEP